MLKIILKLSVICFLVSCASADKEKAQLHLRIGVSHLEGGNYPLALKELLTAEELDPKNPIIQNNLGLAYFVRQRFELSEKHFKRAVDLLPEFSDARNNWGRSLIELKKYNEAAEEIQKVLNDLTYPNPEKAWINMGLLYFTKEQFSSARDSFLKAINLQKDNCVAHTYYGRSSYELKDFSTAASSLDRAVAFCQRSLNDEPHYFSAMSYFNLGDRSRAEARFQEIVKLYPTGKYVEKSRSMLEMLK